MYNAISLPKKAITAFRNSGRIILLLSVFSSCMVKIHPPPSTTPCTFTLNNIFLNCHNPLSGNKIISYKLTFIVWYINGNDKKTLDIQNITSSQTNPSSTVVINSKVPSDATEWEWEVTVTGTQCSTCALTQGPNNYTCIQSNTPSGVTAAIPTLHQIVGPMVRIPRPGYTTINNWSPGENVAGSCGCVVPY